MSKRWAALESKERSKKGQGLVKGNGRGVGDMKED
jgi:hypothetical protein